MHRLTVTKIVGSAASPEGAAESSPPLQWRVKYRNDPVPLGTAEGKRLGCSRDCHEPARKRNRMRRKLCGTGISPVHRWGRAGSVGFVPCIRARFQPCREKPSPSCHSEETRNERTGVERDRGICFSQMRGTLVSGYRSCGPVGESRILLLLF